MPKQTFFKFAPLVGSVLLMLTSFLFFPFATDASTGASYKFWDALFPSMTPAAGIDSEVQSFLAVNLSLFIIASALQFANLCGLTFRGHSIIFWLSLLISISAFLLLRVALGELKNDDANLGLAWVLAYCSFGAMFVDRLVLTRLSRKLAQTGDAEPV